MELAFNREREERLERIVLRERCLALPERELQTVVPPHAHPGAACSGDIGGRAGHEQRARWLDAQPVKGEPVWLGPWLVSACGFGCYDRVEVDAYASSCALPELFRAVGPTPIRTLSLNRPRTSGASGHGPSRSPIPRSRSAARVGGTPASRAACATVSTNGRYGPAEYASRLHSSRHLAPFAALPATSRHRGCESNSAVNRSKRTASYTGSTRLFRGR